MTLLDGNASNCETNSANDLVTRFAERYGFREDELLNTLAHTAFRQIG